MIDEKLHGAHDGIRVLQLNGRTEPEPADNIGRENLCQIVGGHLRACARLVRDVAQKQQRVQQQAQTRLTHQTQDRRPVPQCRDGTVVSRLGEIVQERVHVIGHDGLRHLRKIAFERGCDDMHIGAADCLQVIRAAALDGADQLADVIGAARTAEQTLHIARAQTREREIGDGVDDESRQDLAITRERRLEGLAEHACHDAS